MRWPLLVPKIHPTLVSGHPGAFGAERRHDVHTGVDLYCRDRDAVFAIEDGVVVNVEHFTGSRSEPPSPWWHDTKAVLVEGKSGVVLYGEIDTGLKVGDVLKQGHLVGLVAKVLKEDKGKPMSMLHFELYAPGTKASVWWHLNQPKPATLRDPTPLLVAILNGDS